MAKAITGKKTRKANVKKVKPALQTSGITPGTIVDTVNVTESVNAVLSSWERFPTLMAFRDMVDTLIATHGPTAEIVISHDSYDDCVLEWFVEFMRDETPVETRARLAEEKGVLEDEKKYQKTFLQFEKKEYLRLKKKFG